jgi:hypothetical protein
MEKGWSVGVHGKFWHRAGKRWCASMHSGKLWRLHGRLLCVDACTKFRITQ